MKQAKLKAQNGKNTDQIKPLSRRKESVTSVIGKENKLEPKKSGKVSENRTQNKNVSLKMSPSLTSVGQFKRAFRSFLNEELKEEVPSHPYKAKGKRSLTPTNAKEIMTKIKPQTLKEEAELMLTSTLNYRSRSPVDGQLYSKLFEPSPRDRAKPKLLGLTSGASTNTFSSKFLSATTGSNSELKFNFAENSSPKAAIDSCSNILSCNSFSNILLSNKSLAAYTNRCVNHPQKRSKFYIEDACLNEQASKSNPQFQGLCSSCAVKMISMGYKVEEIAEAEQQEKREKVEYYIEKACKVSELVKYCSGIVENKIGASQNHYQGQLELIEKTACEVNTMFEKISKVLLKVRSEIINEGNLELARLRKEKSLLWQRTKEFELLSKELLLLEESLSSAAFSESTHLHDFSKIKDEIEKTISQCESIGHDSSKLTSLSIQSAFFEKMDLRFKESIQSKHQELYSSSSQPSSFLKIQEMVEQVKQSNEDILGLHASLESSYMGCGLHYDIGSIGHEQDQSVQWSEQLTDKFDSVQGSASKHYATILQKIDENQHNKSIYYCSMMSQDKQEEQNQDGILSENIGESASQQTPELGSKEQVPEYLVEQLSQLKEDYPNQCFVKGGRKERENNKLEVQTEPSQ